MAEFAGQLRAYNFHGLLVLRVGNFVWHFKISRHPDSRGKCRRCGCCGTFSQPHQSQLYICFCHHVPNVGSYSSRTVVTMNGCTTFIFYCVYASNSSADYWLHWGFFLVWNGYVNLISSDKLYTLDFSPWHKICISRLLAHGCVSYLLGPSTTCLQVKNSVISLVYFFCYILHHDLSFTRHCWVNDVLLLIMYSELLSRFWAGNLVLCTFHNLRHQNSVKI